MSTGAPPRRALGAALLCWATLALAGCARAGFAPREAGASPDGQIADGAGPASRQCIPLSGSWSLTTPERVDKPSSTSEEAEVTLSADGRTLYFASLRNGNWDSYQSTRPDLNSPFGLPSLQSGITTKAGELRFLLAADGLTAYLNADWSGGVGEADIWVATRSATTTPFLKAAFSPVPGLNTTADEYDPWISSDGLRIYFSRGPDLKDLNLYLAERATASAAFSAAAAVSQLNSLEVDDNPTLTSDELVIVFDSARSGGAGVKKLWYAVRTSRSEPFSAPQLLPIQSADAWSIEPWIHAPTCELFFVSSSDIYRARFVTP